MYFEKRYLTPPDKIYLFLDEIQSVRDWDKWVRRIYDTGRYYIFITGSTSRLLPREIATSLRGRTINFSIFPFSFREFLSARNYEPNMEILQYTDEKGKILKLLREYLRHGSFPEVILKDNEFEKKKLLSSYFDAILYRDVVDRFRVKDTALLESFISMRREEETYYWKNSLGKEVDFILRDGLRVKELIRVCYKLEDEKTVKREVSSLIKAMNEFELNEGTIITGDYEGIQISNNI